MSKRKIFRIWMATWVVALFCWNCPNTANTKSGGGATTPNKPAKVVARLKGCIKGRVVKENDNGFAYVIVETNPSTSPKITNREGFFEICYKSQRSADGQGASVKVALPQGEYVVSVKKEGFHARPVRFTYQGRDINIGEIKMVEKSRPLPEVVKKTPDKEEKRTSGVGGKAPIPE
ncbi:MAG: hypothetical protein EP343_30945 [Deltaproteobacteria bacterium]|nr:MAG: hypothetical protein EP343_30945 [Deltaproteobacteria bacterium]